jgi:hypothetical protein
MISRAECARGMVAEKGTELGGPWSDHLEGPVWELRVRLAARDLLAGSGWTSGSAPAVTVFVA